MSEPSLVLVRHGDTEWSESARHTGRTDLPLLPHGAERARGLAATLAGGRFALVLSSPLQRASETARLAGFGDRLELCDDLCEWDYGDYEGLTTEEIREREPGWSIWLRGAPRGESPAEVAARADRVIERALGAGGDTLLFAHGHILRILAARWLGEGPELGACLLLQPASVSKLGHERERRVIERWNADGL